MGRSDTYFGDCKSPYSRPADCKSAGTGGNNHLSYSYGFNEQRIGMNEEVDGMIRTKIYTGNCEFVTANGQQKTLTYLTSPYGVFAVVEKQGEDESLHFVLKDHLGSWTVITDEHGEVEQEVSFDAWGNLRNPETWANYSENETYEEPMFDRGYTGHEHLAAFGLINMNGRMYDPTMSSFLSVDRFVQSFDNSQSFNRYAYCLYNPLRYVDPTGWRPGIGNGRPDDPPGLDNYQPGIYNSVDSESAYVVCLNEVIVPGTSGGASQSCSDTYYTEGTSWDDGQYYSYFGVPTDAGPNLQESTNGYGGGGGGAIGMGSNNLSGNSKLTPGVLSYPTAAVSTLLGASSYSYKQTKNHAALTDLGKSLSKAQKAKLAAKYPKELTKGASAAKYGAKYASKLGTVGNVLGGVGLGISVYDVITTDEIRPSNIYELTTSMTCVALAYFCTGPVGWIAGAVFLGAEIFSYAYTGMSVGENLNQRIDWSYNKQR